MMARISAASAALILFAGAAEAAPKYGCFKVTADGVNIRGSAFSSGAVVGTAPKGAILIKRKPYCTLRGFWCAVSYKGVDGWADKKYYTITTCPKDL